MKEKVRKLLGDKPEYEKYLRQILEWHENDYEEVRGFRKEPAINTQVAPIRTQRLNYLAERGVLEILAATSTRKIFKLKDPEAVRSVLRERKMAEEVTQVRPVREEEVPGDLFDIVIGHEDLKWLFDKSIKSEKQHHILLVGPPSTAKTVILLELGRLPGSNYVLGHSTTSPGLTDQLFDTEPRYVLIDEIDKMDRKDFGALLSLMETGIVKETKTGKQREMELTANVYGACNQTRNIPPELLSRFEALELEKYSPREFLEVCEQLLTRREGVEEDMAHYIAVEALELERDVRIAVRISRICETEEDVDRYVRILKKY